MRMHDKTNHGIIKGRINPHQVNKKKDLTLHSSLNHAWTLQCFSAAMLVFEGPILHQMVAPKACQSFLGSQTFLASNILLPKKDNKCQLFHSPKSSLWNIVISVCWAGIRTSRSSSFLRILRELCTFDAWNLKHDPRFGMPGKLLCSNTFEGFHVSQKVTNIVIRTQVPLSISDVGWLFSCDPNIQRWKRVATTDLGKQIQHTIFWKYFFLVSSFSPAPCFPLFIFWKILSKPLGLISSSRRASAWSSSKCNSFRRISSSWKLGTFLTTGVVFFFFFQGG